MLNKLSVSELAQLSNFSKSYISQIKSGKRPPSPKLLIVLEHHSLTTKPQIDYYALFLNSRCAMGVSSKTLEFYKDRLSRFCAQVPYLKASRVDIEKYLNTIPSNRNGLATRHASYRAIKTFYVWLESNFGIENPTIKLPAPILTKVILPSLTGDQVKYLIDMLDCVRDKAIVALFVESGLRLSELSNIQPKDINWDGRTVQVIGKGRKEALAPFGKVSEGFLKVWLDNADYETNIWGINQQGIKTMLRRLSEKTGLPCNPHTFRRTFACLLRKAGVDTMTIKDLGRWESLEMVQRYTRSVNFHDSLKFYKALLT
ncbi:tyrosine-type recombinase/integrase [Dehalococcoides mccartyi]|uniref:tyrosine-type recombinase/integrase n=1 Tax=Dehalococcoides mccartyi TaxID=61435 RepID=UPI00187D0AD0|nr:tyrosine-type recombinase/integrase [Dehalococcoides mccartyi]